MLTLKDICKDYLAGDNAVHALKNVNMQFRANEFVSVLGQSGCGKTTMLNIVGGLDRYTSGDLIIDGVSTKAFQDVDWDAYRNLRVGFIFQSYNLIPHIDILSNVEMALTLSGVGASERRQRAMRALEQVGLQEQARKRPNQLSGGQMQRVSIARALINNPEIILADEPTGALDSATSVQIMDLLQKIAQEKLVIMVTHNAELAQQYSTRIIRLSDGEVVDDTNPIGEEELRAAQADDEARAARETQEICAAIAPARAGRYESREQIERDATLDDKKRAKWLAKYDRAQKKRERKIERERVRAKKRKLGSTSMSYRTACKLSFNNLMTKKGRTVMTSIAGSIGIIGVALVLAISNGFTGYIGDLQRDVLAGYPIEIARSSVDTNKLMGLMMGGDPGSSHREEYPDKDTIYSYNPMLQYLSLFVNNDITADYVDYVAQLESLGYADSVRYSYGVDMNVVGKVNTAYKDFINLDEYTKVNHSSDLLSQMGGMMGGGSSSQKRPDVGWQQLTGDKDYVLTQYEVLAGAYPQNKNEAVLVVDKSNQLNQSTLASLGLAYDGYTSFDQVYGENGLTFYVATNGAYYIDNGDGTFRTRDGADVAQMGEEQGVVPVKVVGILRRLKDAKLTTLNTGVAYTEDLTRYIMQDCKAHADEGIIAAQKAAGAARNVVTGAKMTDNEYKDWLEDLGAIETPSYIQIFPKDFASKEKVMEHLDAWNKDHTRIQYSDMSQFATDFMSEMVRIISIVLVCFASVSLLVSSVMIGIITYVSVVERTKEIGILRSLGARKRDISNVFNAETALIGLIAGVIGVLATYILSIPINALLKHFYGIAGLCSLSVLHAALMIAISMTLTIIAGLVPSRIASKRDPVVALRTE